MTEAPGMGLVLDCHDPEALAPFWAAALGYVTLGSVENYFLLVRHARPSPKLLRQRAPEERAGSGCTSTSKCPTSRAMLLDCRSWEPDASAMASRQSTGVGGSS